MKTNTILIIVGALVLAGGAYYYFFTGTSTDAALSSTPAPSPAQLKFEQLSGQLPSSFSTDIFKDPRFLGLVDITQPIQPDPIGRLDPFAPLGGTAVTNGATP